MSDFTAHIDTFARDRLPPKSLWPDLDFSRLTRWEGGERVNLAAAILDGSVAAGHGDRAAVRARGLVWTYDELLERANRIARVLRDDLGLVPGNRVLLRGPNSPMMAACWFGVLKAGGVLVATMPLLRAAELTHITDKAQVGLALCDQRFAAEIESVLAAGGAPRRVVCFGHDGGGAAADSLESMMRGRPGDFTNVDTAADDVAMIAFTSGTTGPAKGCIHFHRGPLACAEAFGRHVAGTAADDIVTGTPPLAFTFGMGGLLVFPLLAGASTALLETTRAEDVLQAVEDHRATMLYTAPTAFRAMTPMVGNYDLSSLKACFSAGETLPLPTYTAWTEATGVPVLDGLGSTEMFHTVIANCAGHTRPGATGCAVPGFEARVVDATGRPVPAGTVGSLAVRGPTGCLYLDDAGRQTDYVRDGWNLTGDAVSADEDGYFWYRSRTDDMIVSSGYNISGPEVEAALLEHPAVLECAVIGAADPRRGQVVKAFIVLRGNGSGDDATAAELQDFVKARIAPYKYPRSVAFIPALPRTGNGKVMRAALRDRAP